MNKDERFKAGDIVLYEGAIGTGNWILMIVTKFKRGLGLCTIASSRPNFMPTRDSEWRPGRVGHWHNFQTRADIRKLSK